MAICALETMATRHIPDDPDDFGLVYGGHLTPLATRPESGAATRIELLAIGSHPANSSATPKNAAPTANRSNRTIGQLWHTHRADSRSSEWKPESN